MKQLIIILLFVISCSSPTAEQTQKAQSAEKLFAKGELEQSHKLYEELEKSGVSNTLIYERLAESSNNSALSIFYLRKALQIAPECETCAEKLDKLRSGMKFSPMLKNQALLSVNIKSILLIGISALFSTWILLVFIIPRKIFLIGLAPLSLATFWILAGSYCGVDYPSQIETCILKGKVIDEKEAVVIADNALVLSSRKKTAQGVMTLAMGSEIIITAQQKKWAQIKLPNNRSGWVPIKAIKFID